MHLAGKNVLLITSTNLACNPRCLKELRLLNEAGARISLVAFNLHNWTTEKEKAIQRELNGVESTYLETTRSRFFLWAYSTFMEKASRALSTVFHTSIYIDAMTISKRSWILWQWARNWKGKADLIIAHNPPAFYAAARLSKKWGVPFALDIEDYHPGEGIDVRQKTSLSRLMGNLIPKTAYTSYAAPLIEEYTERLLKINATSKGIVVNNSFPLVEFQQPQVEVSMKDTLQMVWFSQYVDYGRGLEKILPILDKFPPSIELTLIGDLRMPFYESEIKGRNYIRCVDSLPQVDLNKNLSNYDIGLALEDSNADFNRNICLTNKIWAYFQAGLYILATDTAAQQNFIGDHPEHGLLTTLEPQSLEVSIETLLLQKNMIRAGKSQRYHQAKQNCWEQESLQLQVKWAEILD